MGSGREGMDRSFFFFPPYHFVLCFGFNVLRDRYKSVSSRSCFLGQACAKPLFLYVCLTDFDVLRVESNKNQ